MAKKEQKTQNDILSDEALSAEMERALADAAWDESPAPAEPPPPAQAAPVAPKPATPPRPAASSGPSGKEFDTSALHAGHSEIQNRLRTFVESFEGLGKSWEGFGDQLARANNEIERLRGVERNRDELVSRIAGLENELREAKAGAASATERSAKFEDLYETMKERAVELNAAVQDAEVKEKALNEDLKHLREQLTEAGRREQDVAMARAAAEETIKKLEAADAAARDRIAKLLDDNKAMANQVPALLSERERLQKQFSASERENARLNNERQLAGVRMADLEEEIRTLRADLASLSSGRAAPAPLAIAPADPVPVVPIKGPGPAKEQAPAAELDDVEISLEETLEQAFARDMEKIVASKQ